MRLPFLLLVATVLSSARSLHRPAIPAELIRRDDDLKIQTTCRWTNCGEGCPAGFTPVLRADGNRGEVMWDHTHCYEHGMQTFCCPGVSTEWPTCRWSGHKNSGKCQPGCPAGEVEVGTLNFGCKSGHQSACCTHSYAVAAYGQCKWVVTGGLFCSLPSSPGGHSAAPCPDFHPQFIFSAKAGFGGEVPCVLGEKNYCCTSETKLWKNCGWHNKETSRFPQDVCEPSCPKNQVLLGMQKGECSEGEAAYCCEGLVESHPNPAPNWQPLLESFQQNLNLYKNFLFNDKWCSPLTWPDFGGHHGPTADIATASDEPNDITTAKNRGLQCESSWKAIRDVLLAITKRDRGVETKLEVREQEMWDLDFGNRYEGTSVADLREYWERWPDKDLNRTLTEMLYDIPFFGLTIVKMKKAQEDLCVSPEDLDDYLKRSGVRTHSFTKGSLTDSNLTSRADDHDGRTRSEPRYIRPLLEGWTGPERAMHEAGYAYPTFGTILEGIRWGHLSLHYAQWFWVQGTNTQTSPPGTKPGLELAYWIGPEPGIANNLSVERILNLRRYRDARPDRFSLQENFFNDRWVVFHFHFHGIEPLMYRRLEDDWGEDSFLGFTTVNMFHANNVDIRSNPSRWEVDTWQRQGVSMRSTWDCPWRPDEGRSQPRIWVGPGMDRWPDDYHYDQFREWLHGLYTDGYLSVPGLIPIMNNPVLIGRWLASNEPRHGYRSIENAPASNSDLWSYPWDTPFRIEYANWPYGQPRYLYDFPQPEPWPSNVAPFAVGDSGSNGSNSTPAQRNKTEV